MKSKWKPVVKKTLGASVVWLIMVGYYFSVPDDYVGSRFWPFFIVFVYIGPVMILVQAVVMITLANRKMRQSK